MRSTQDLPPIDSTIQEEPIAFDFQPYLPPGVTLTGTPTVLMTVAADSDVADADVGDRILGSPVKGKVDPPHGAGIDDTAVIVLIGQCVAGVTYLLHCHCRRSDGGNASLWTRMKCFAPA